ncbi:MAG TPA: lysylphosphatidylglycerol synthase transmembrane domain-containing protein [Acidimicrobiia bacterium]|nr:lysylphosphatidylglycerol synthase transmembrane domain-containing protein [Acidimicrobiia bacterium]
MVRAVASIAMLALLLPRIDLGSILPRGQHVATVRWVTIGVVITLLGFVLSAWRWQRVLAVFEEHVPLPRLVSHYLAGQFVGNFLPSTIGGDVLRVSRVSNQVGSSATAFASVVLERMTGWVILPLLSLAGILLHPSLFELGFAPRFAVGLALCTLALLVLVLIAAGSTGLAGRFAEHEGWQRFIGSVHVGVDRLRRQPRGALGVMGTAAVYQLSMVATVFAATRAIGLDISAYAVLAFAPAVLIAQVLPFSLNGIGLREGAFVLFLGPLGASTTQAVGVGLVVYGMTLIVSLLGAPAFAVGGGRRRLTVVEDDAGSEAA